MSKYSRVRKGRDKWKSTAVERGNKIRYLNRENRRLKRDRDKYKTEAREARKKLKVFDEHIGNPVRFSIIIVAYNPKLSFNLLDN